MNVMESIIGIFGSRFSFNFRPRESKVYHSGLGRYFDAPVDFALGIDVDGETEAFPFTAKCKHFPSTSQAQTMNSIAFTGTSNDFLAEIQWTISSHFYPKDEMLTTLPVFIIDIDIRKTPTRSFAGSIEGKLFLHISRPGTTITINDDGGAILDYVSDGLPVQDAIVAIGKDQDILPMSLNGDELVVLDAPYMVDTEFIHVATIFWGTHVASPVLETKRGDVVLAYTKYFSSVTDAVNYAIDHETEIRPKIAAFDAIFLDPSIGKTKSDFLAYAHQSFVQNAWLGYLPDGREWYSSWEGNCQFHSTIDVEYNQAFWYFCFWPELMELLLDEWADYTKVNALGLTFLSHDMGQRRLAVKQVYGHEMEVEENANYLLLLLMQWKLTGKTGIIESKKDLVELLADHLIGVARTGSGFPTEGTANTIDDASPAIQYAREQTYLGVKTLCALQAAAEIAKAIDNAGLMQRCSDQVNVIKQTLEERACIGDHYAVCIDKEASGLNEDGKIFTPYPTTDGKIEGWDAYTLYTSNGMLYLLASGMIPNLDLDLIKLDLVNAWRASLGEFGNFHSSTDHSNCWLSQNMFRDFVGMYLGTLIDQFDRYWNFELFENTAGRGGCFTDTYGHNHLCYYPRGATSFGLFFALAGVSVDFTSIDSPIVTIRPRVVPVTVPLVQFAEWNALVPKVPVVRTWLENGELKVSIDKAECLENVDLRIEVT